VLLLAAGTAATAQVPNSNQNNQNNQNAQPPGGPPAANTTSTPTSELPTAPAVTISGQKANTGPPLPKLPPDQFANCTRRRMGLANPESSVDLNDLGTTTWLCETQLNYEEQVVIDACLDRDGKTPPPRIIQACTEALDHKLLDSDQNYFLIASRADAYFIYGDRQHALDDYTAAIKLVPHNALLYYDRGVVFVSQRNDEAALQDFATAMSIDSKLAVPALLHRAKIHAARGDFTGAVAEFSQAISLQPKTAELWSDRGYVALGQRDYHGAVKDEAQAIELDPKLARAYYLRGVAFGDLGNRASAVDDLRTAVTLDASLAHYVLIQGKNVTLTLPPL
jgi:tetratricopeptide (TPR) repeat protein